MIHAPALAKYASEAALAQEDLKQKEETAKRQFIWDSMTSQQQFLFNAIWNEAKNQYSQATPEEMIHAMKDPDTAKIYPYLAPFLKK